MKTVEFASSAVAADTSVAVVNSARTAFVAVGSGWLGFFSVETLLPAVGEMTGVATAGETFKA